MSVAIFAVLALLLLLILVLIRNHFDSNSSFDGMTRRYEEQEQTNEEQEQTNEEKQTNEEAQRKYKQTMERLRKERKEKKECVEDEKAKWNLLTEETKFKRKMINKYGGECVSSRTYELLNFYDKGFDDYSKKRCHKEKVDKISKYVWFKNCGFGDYLFGFLGALHRCSGTYFDPETKKGTFGSKCYNWAYL
jgi:hypothetical protein